ncbi:MAG TPA: D-aminoacyl-tRNA deacylase [Pelobium sp.]
MRAVIQRVSEAKCVVNNQVTGEICDGFVVLLGLCAEDTEEDLSWLAQKIVNLRVFSDDAGLMNKSLMDKGGNILLISQFTLFAQTKKGNRPSFINAAKPSIAIPLYEKMISQLEMLIGKKLATGIFGADMKIHLINDGPVTITIDTKNKE